ncbi:SCO6880 family protein [Mumia sp. Pv 4-285]|uniref:SCO6880 family protein n=1 Tax=Mumia qirimensis TaxID=3234852 RepID=UPI00351D52E3
MTSYETQESYLFGPRDRGAILLGLRLNQLLLLTEGVILMMIGFVAGGGSGGLLGLLALLVCAFLAFFPVQGRPIIDWGRPVANYVAGRLSGEATYLGGPWAVHKPVGGADRIALPGGRDVIVREFRTDASNVAVIRDGHRWTAVVQVVAPAFPLADRATQHARVTSWGSLLAQLGQEGSRLAAIQWLERTIPDSGRGLDDWWRERGDATSPAAAAYEQLISDKGPSATRHESFVVISIDSRRCRRAIRAAGGGREGAAAVLTQELTWIESGLRRCSVDVVGWLGARDLGRLIRTQYDPASTVEIDRRGREGLERGVAIDGAGPMIAESRFGHSRTDSGYHATYWVASWPRMQVQAAWLYPLLVLGGVRRTLSLTAEPVAPSKSFREIRSAKVQKRTDEINRQKIGQIESAQDDEENLTLERRERELVRGHVEYRFNGYVTVTAATEQELDDACSQVEQAAVRSVLEVRRVYGEQNQAFIAAALPLARGVRS